MIPSKATAYLFGLLLLVSGILFCVSGSVTAYNTGNYQHLIAGLLITGLGTANMALAEIVNSLSKKD